MNNMTNYREILSGLEAHPDEGLCELIHRANAILAARQDKRAKDALQEICRIARAHGIDIAVKKPPGKRGRPPKAKPSG